MRTLTGTLTTNHQIINPIIFCSISIFKIELFTYDSTVSAKEFKFLKIADMCFTVNKITKNTLTFIF